MLDRLGARPQELEGRLDVAPGERVHRCDGREERRDDLFVQPLHQVLSGARRLGGVEK